MVTWTINIDSGGRAEVMEGTRKSHGTFQSPIAAMRHVHTKMTKDDHLIQVDPDGYRTRLRGKRRGWRQPR